MASWARLGVILASLALVAAGCSCQRDDETAATTSSSSTTSSTTTTTAAPTTTSVPTTTTWATTGHPADGQWTLTEDDWAVTIGCCGTPPRGPASPPITAPADDDGTGLSGLADGYYDVNVTRDGDVLDLQIRAWVPCTDESCAAAGGDDTLEADPSTEIERRVAMDDGLAVRIEPYGGGAPPTEVLVGSGRALLDLFAGPWCDPIAEHPYAGDCGIDVAYDDWITRPLAAGASRTEVADQIARRAQDADFPLEAFDVVTGEPACQGEGNCGQGYRGPHETILGLALFPDLAGPENLYAWSASLRVQGGVPELHLTMWGLFIG